MFVEHGALNFSLAFFFRFSQPSFIIFLKFGSLFAAIRILQNVALAEVLCYA